MKNCILILAFISTSRALVTQDIIDAKWNTFKEQYDRQFSDPESEAFRKSLFEEKLQEVEKHNERYGRGLESYTIDINEFSDRTKEETYRFTHDVFSPPRSLLLQNQNTSKPSVSPMLQFFGPPASWDWNQQGIIGPVRHQGDCGASWAFAVTGAIEAYLRKIKKVKVTLSTQQLIDCVDSLGPERCDGGWSIDAFRYLSSTGLSQDNYYPYRGSQKFCHYQTWYPHYQISDYTEYQPPNENSLKNYIYRNGPLVAAIDASGPFAGYKGGVYYNSKCDSKVTHMVLIVGYGCENGQEYWLVKNSWGTNWGINGYAKIARNRQNHCNIASYLTAPIL